MSLDDRTVADGYFYIVDRKKDLIISGGFSVYPSEIEEVMFQDELPLSPIGKVLRKELRAELRGRPVRQHDRRLEGTEAVKRPGLGER